MTNTICLTSKKIFCKNSNLDEISKNTYLRPDIFTTLLSLPAFIKV